MERATAGLGTHPPVVVLVGYRASGLVSASPWVAAQRYLSITGVCGQLPPRAEMSDDQRFAFPVYRPGTAVEPTEPGVGQGMRRAIDRAATGLTARRARTPRRWLRALRADPTVATILGGADVIVSLDVESDRALAVLPELTCSARVIPSVDRATVETGLTALTALIEMLRVRCETVDWSRRYPTVRWTAEDWEALDAIAPVDRAAALPKELVPVDELADLFRWVSAVVAPQTALLPIAKVIDRFGVSTTSSVGTAGLRAQFEAAKVWTVSEEAELPSGAEIAERAGRALDAADAATAAGEHQLARGRLIDGLALMFQRELHAENLSSPLVRDPAGYLAPLMSSTTYQQVVGGGRRRKLRLQSQDARAGEVKPRVLVLTSAYGDFHAEVVRALGSVATVAVKAPPALGPFFRRKGVDPHGMEVFAALRRLPGVTDRTVANEVHADIAGSLAAQLRRADVVFADWADRSSIWASHLVPEGARFVLRVHSLDTLHPWFHFTDWSAVDQVLVVSEPLRAHVAAMLRAAGHDVPVTVIPNMLEISEEDLHLSKDESARTTLGMVGWGRRVKDPLWALELLRREPSWRLVLIGPRLGPGRSMMARTYYETVTTILAEPEIKRRVEVVGQTDDVPRHLRKVGVILSSSRRESWHLGLVEGVQSGAVPVVRDWPTFQPVGGARALFPADWVVDDLDEAEARIRHATDPQQWSEMAAAARRQVATLVDDEAVASAYRNLILGPCLR